MTKLIKGFFILFIILTIGSNQTRAAATPDSFADLAEKLLPTVVNISSTQKIENTEIFPEMPSFPPGSPFEDFFEEFMDRHDGGIPSIPPASLGSGFVIDAEKGYIVTNGHVVKDADEVRVTLHDDTILEAEVIGRDEKTDLAVIKITTDHDLKAAAFGDSSQMRVGDWVVAIGNPFGLGGTVTAGIVSAQQRDINAGPYDDFIQTDASINRGNSGGPMFNLKGEVIGINTAIFSPSGGSVGIGFAIPANLAQPIIDQLTKYGRTRRGWMGVRIQSVTDEIAESLGLDKSTGALIAAITPTGPSEKAGLKPGDIILNFDGREVHEMRELPRIVAETEIDSEINVTYWRDGKEHKTTIIIGELEKAEESGIINNETITSSNDTQTDDVKLNELGLTVKSLSPVDREKYGISESTNGVLITKVTNNSEAAEKGLGAGEVILEVNQKPVTKISDLRAAISNAKKSKRHSVLLLVSRDDDVRFVALRIKKK